MLQWPSLRREGFRYRPILNWRDESFRRVLVLMGPGTIGLAATQVNVLVNTVLATGEGTGAVSWLNYAFRLMYLPIGLFGVSVATAMLPAVSRHVAMRDERAARSTIADGLSLMLMLNIPATVGLMVLAPSIVRLIFERGAFVATDTAATAAAVQFYAIGLVGYSVVRITSPVFYALGQNRTPVIVSVATVLINAVLNIWLVGLMGYQGLALGTSIAALFNATALMVLLRRRLGGIEGARVSSSLVRIALAAAVMGVAAVAAEVGMGQWIPGDRLLPQIVRLMTTIGVAVGALGASAYLLRVPEFREAVTRVSRKLGVGSR
jgi:putative peptidoglycan lipid II flippase